MSVLSKLKITLLLAIFIFSAFLSPLIVAPAYAQTPSTSTQCRNIFDLGCKVKQLFKESVESVTGDNAWSWISSAMTAIISWFNRALLGDIYYAETADELNAMMQNSEDVGLLGLATHSIASIYNNKTINSTDYLASINPFKPAYATGYELLNPVVDLWRIFRNVSYIFIVAALVAFGFLIMFRYKIDPRTVIQISDALPKLVVALVLITFSYAIVGFIIDISKVSERLIMNVVSPVKTQIETQLAAGKLDSSRVKLVGGAVVYPQEYAIEKIWDDFRGVFTGLSIGSFGPASGIVGSIATLIFAVMVFSIMMSLLMSLIRYFATFFLLTIFGPFFILWAIIPGQEETLRKWFMQLFTAAIVFPAVLLMMNLAYFVHVWLSGGAAGNVATVLPGTVLTDSAPILLQSQTTPAFVGSLLAAGIILITAKVPAIIEEALKSAPAGSIDRAGPDAKGAAKKIPFIGGFF